MMPAQKAYTSDLQGTEVDAVVVLKAHLGVSSHCQKVWPWHRLAWAVSYPAGRQV